MIDVRASGIFDYLVGINTSHGYQLSPNWYLGIGAGFNMSFETLAITLPVFAHGRFTLKNSNKSPFLDVKLGYSVTEYTGLYTSGQIGYRFGFSNGDAIYLSVGYTLFNNIITESNTTKIHLIAMLLNMII